MRITIEKSLRPFTHLPGTFCPIPFTHLGVRAFPAYIQIFSLLTFPYKLVDEFEIKVSGRVEDFTVCLDLEKGNVAIFGKAKEGYFRYRILPGLKPNLYQIQVEKSPSSSFLLSSPDLSPIAPFCIKERLSLGSHKKLDWELVKRRQDLSEILPVWHRLGLMIKKPMAQSKESADSLLSQCEKTLMNEKKEIYEQFLSLFYAGFLGILTPRCQDEEKQGFLFPPLTTSCPLLLLEHGATLIRKLFLQHNEQSINVLPALPSQFHAGRFLNSDLPKVSIDMEWSKKSIRRMVFKAKSTGVLFFIFPKNVKTMRLSIEGQEKGQRVNCEKRIDIEEGNTYFLDQFRA